MTTKYLGPSVSGYLDPSGRAWETVVFQAGKPVLDKELILEQDISELRATASGWVSSEFTSKAAGKITDIFTSATAPDIINLPAITALVNGWVVNVNNTDANGWNMLTLPAAPVAAGAHRTDVVILEVWRRLLSASPDTTGKSFTGLIWRDGNVKISVADDAVLNYADDILDVLVGSESTKRVQIQYRLRVISGVDIFSYPYAMDDPTIVANSVPPAAVTPDGVATAFNYTNLVAAPERDGGLWRAGDGNPANALGTVDGYMYAVPLLGVFRRNSAAWDKNTNHNGGVAFPGPPDRPDGLFYDEIVADDIADLRTVAQPIELTELLDKNMTYLLDNSLRSEWMQTAIGGGVEGHTPFYACEIGVLPGDGITTGDTPGADFIGEFDAVRRRFSDRPLVETITLAIPAPMGGWVPGSTFTIDPTALPVYPYAAFNWAALNSGQEVFRLISRAYWIGSASGQVTEDAFPYIQTITNLGEVPVVALNVTLVSTPLPAGITTETLYMDLKIAYPSGLGLTATPVDDFAFQTYMVNNPAQLPNAAPIWCDPAQLNTVGAITYFDNSATTAIDYPHREVLLTYQTTDQVIVMAADTTGPSTEIQLPERALDPIVLVERSTPPGAFAPVANPVTMDPANGFKVIDVNIADASAPGDEWRVTYKALRPMPQNGEQFTIFFNVRAPQSARTTLLGLSKEIIPRYIPKHLYTLTCGSGAQGEAYPFPQAYVQTGGIFPSLLGTFGGEHELQEGPDIETATFSSRTGLLSLPTYIDFTPNPDEVTFTRALTDIDAEGRTFFPDILGAVYRPNAYAQPLSDPMRHKVVLPFIGELATTTGLGVAGQMVLVLLTRWVGVGSLPLDAVNGVYFDSNPNTNTTSASVFRLRNTVLNKR